MRRRRNSAGDKEWRTAGEIGEGKVHDALFAAVSSIEQEQSDIFERFVKLSYLYSQNSRGPMVALKGSAVDALVTENVIASNVDTVHAAIASTEVRARFMTDDGDWATQRRARHLELYGNGLAKKIQAPVRGRRAFKDCALKGTGLVKTWVDEFKRIRCERLLVDNVVVDEADCREGDLPVKLHYREIVAADELKARYPGHDAEIDRAVGSSTSEGARYWADYRPLGRRDVVVIEGWHLPIGVRGRAGYQPGRHVIAIEGFDLLDEPYHKAHYPIDWIYWSEPDTGWYGIGLAQRIAGHQRRINKYNFQEDCLIDHWAHPTQWVRLQDANISVKTVNAFGRIGVYKTDVPKTVVPPSVPPEMLNRHADLRESASHESGVSRMAAHAAKPAGLESGVALREYRDQTTQRFAQQEKRYEAFQLRIIERLIECAKELGESAPEIVRKSRFGKKALKWADVDMGEVAIQIVASSDLAKTPSGRLQLAIEWAQAGVISQDEARRLMRHPDTERSMSLYTAAIEHIDRVLDDGLDGHVIVPDPYMNLTMAVWRGTAQLQIADDDGAPEDVLDVLRQFIDTAAHLHAMASAPAPAQMPGAMVDPMAPELGPPNPGMAGDMGPGMVGAGVSPANLLQ